MRVGSLYFVPINDNPNGTPVFLNIPKGTVTMGYPTSQMGSFGGSTSDSSRVRGPSSTWKNKSMEIVFLKGRIDAICCTEFGSICEGLLVSIIINPGGLNG